MVTGRPGGPHLLLPFRFGSTIVRTREYNKSQKGLDLVALPPNRCGEAARGSSGHRTCGFRWLAPTELATGTSTSKQWHLCHDVDVVVERKSISIGDRNRTSKAPLSSQTEKQITSEVRKGFVRSKKYPAPPTGSPKFGAALAVSGPRLRQI